MVNLVGQLTSRQVISSILPTDMMLSAWCERKLLTYTGSPKKVSYRIDDVQYLPSHPAILATTWYHSSCLESLYEDFVSIALPVIGFFLAEQRLMTNTSSTAMSVLRAIVMPGFAIHQIWKILDFINSLSPFFWDTLSWWSIMIIEPTLLGVRPWRKKWPPLPAAASKVSPIHRIRDLREKWYLYIVIFEHQS